MHMWASDEVCAGIFTLLCMLSPLIKRDHQEKEECEECNMRNGLGTMYIGLGWRMLLPG